jgi:hypothetical protein
MFFLGHGILDSRALQDLLFILELSISGCGWYGLRDAKKAPWINEQTVCISPTIIEHY